MNTSPSPAYLPNDPRDRPDKCPGARSPIGLQAGRSRSLCSVPMVIEIVDYDASWPSAFAEAAEQLREVGEGRWQVEHIGSTSVPGLSAKPIIDLAVRVESFDELEDRRQDLVVRGWLAIRRQPRSHRVRVRDDQGPHTYCTLLHPRTLGDVSPADVSRLAADPS